MRRQTHLLEVAGVITSRRPTRTPNRRAPRRTAIHLWEVLQGDAGPEDEDPDQRDHDQAGDADDRPAEARTDVLHLKAPHHHPDEDQEAAGGNGAEHFQQPVGGRLEGRNGDTTTAITTPTSQPNRPRLRS